MMVSRFIRSAPSQRDTDVAGHAIGPIGDLEFHTVSTRLEVHLPELIKFLRQTRQRIFPTRLLLVYGASFVRKHSVWEPADFDLRQTIGYGTLDDGSRPLHALFIAHSRRLGEAIEQLLFLGLGCLTLAHIFGGFFGLHHRALLAAIQCARQSIVCISCHPHISLCVVTQWDPTSY